MAVLEKEIWINQIQENFYPESSFLKYGKDFSALVDNNAINMAEAGIDPNVLINNTTYCSCKARGYTCENRTG